MKIRSLLFLFLLLFLAACSNNDEVEQAKGENVEEETTEKGENKEKEKQKVEFPQASSVPTEIVQQAKGKSVDEAKSLMETGNDATAWEELLRDLNAKELEQTDLYNGLIYSFGADLKDSYEALANFVPDYGEYDLEGNQDTFKNIAIHLDSSGSMAAYVPGGIKMDLAKSAIKKYASGLPQDSVISLRVYGHEGTGSDNDKTLSCSSTAIMYDANSYQDEGFTNALTQFKPSGWTPLAATIKSAYDDLKVRSADNSENILFIVSDGIETCGGNPVEEAKRLANSDLNVKVNIIGFNVDDEGQKQLKETAAAGNGTYYTVNSNIDLDNTIAGLLEDAQTSIQKNFEKGRLGYQANMHSVKVGDQIGELNLNFKDAIYEESKVLHEAAYQLQRLEYITQEEGQALTTLIDERYDALFEFKNQLYSDANDKNKARLKEVHNGISAS